MAARLTVIVSQSPRRDSQTANLEEELVAQIMMTGGLDATMVGPLENIQADDTDFLCLSGFNHNLALVSWLPRAEVQSAWDRLGLGGVVVDPDAGQPTANGTRRIYYLELDSNSTVERVSEQLAEILASRRVSTFSIGIGGDKSPNAVVNTPGDQAAPNPPLPTVPLTHKATGSAQEEKINRSPTVPHVSPTDRDEPDADEEWPELDQLVDDLDTLDL